MEEVKLSKLTEALAKAQNMIQGAVKDSENPYFKSSYADLASVWEACRKPLTQNGLAIIQITRMIEGKLYLETILSHISGESVSGLYPINPMRQEKDKDVATCQEGQDVKWKPSKWVAAEDPQSLGSALTYARRYALAAIVGVAPEDDDGEGAVGRGKQGEPKKSIEEIHKESEIKFAALHDRMAKIVNGIELQNWWKKHNEEIKTLLPEHLEQIEAFKNHLKKEFTNV